MLVPVTILLPQEVANMIQRAQTAESKKSSKQSKVLQTFSTSTKVQKKDIKGTASSYNFTPRFLDGKTASQLFFEIEDQQKNYCQMLSFDLARVSNHVDYRQANKPVKRSKQTTVTVRKIKKRETFGRKNPVGQKIQKKSKTTKAQKQSKKNGAVNFVPRLFGKRTPSQLFRVSQNSNSQQKASKQNNKPEPFVPRLFGKRTSSQLFLVSKIVTRQAQLQYKNPKNTRGVAQKVNKFVPRLFGQRTPSQLFLQANPQSSKAKVAKGASVKKNIPLYGTTGQHGYLTPSRLLNPYRIKRERYYTLGKGRKTPSELYLAYARQHKYRPSLFGGFTASQLLTVAKRQANRSQNDQQFEGFPTVSQLGLNKRSSKTKSKPTQPSTKLLKHLNQWPMEKSKRIDDPLIGLTASQLLLLSDKSKLKPQNKKTNQSQKNPHAYFNKKASKTRDEVEKTKLTPFLFGF